MDFLKMKEALAFLGVLALAVSLWFLKEHIDTKLVDSKNETIKSLQDTVQANEDVIAKNNALLDSGNSMIKLLQESLQAKEDVLEKNKTEIDSQGKTIKSLQDGIRSKDETITRNNAVISVYQSQLADLSKKEDEDKNKDDGGEKIYPADNSFNAQDLGTGFFAYQVFGPIKNPHGVKFPDKIPNHTPWKFGDGNSGIAANGSGLFVTGAKNFDSDGSSSTNGQAAFLEFAGSSISQSVKLPLGTYSVTFDYEGRQDYAPANQIAVSFDGTDVFKGTPTDCDHFDRVTTETFTVTKPGKHELMFRGLGAIGDVSGFHTTFIDNIRFNVIKTQAPTPQPPIIPDVEMDDSGPLKTPTHL
jgi:hypothetical protein